MSYYFVDQVREFTERCLLKPVDDEQQDENEGEVRQQDECEDEEQEQEEEEQQHLSGVEKWQNRYKNLIKEDVLLAAQIFHDPVAVRENPRRCCTVITQLLHLQNMGQYLSGTEATEVFFGATKLFMSDDASLRRMVYLFIKDVANICHPDDLSIVTHCLTIDVVYPSCKTCNVDLYSANALRVLSNTGLVQHQRLLEKELLVRYLKDFLALAGSSSRVATATLVAGSQILEGYPSSADATIVQGWIPEVKKVATGIGMGMKMMQFHAFSLMALAHAIQGEHHPTLPQWLVQTVLPRKLVDLLSPYYSPLTLVQLIRWVSKLPQDVPSGQEKEKEQATETTEMVAHVKQLRAFLTLCLNHRSDMVAYEAARAICHLEGSSIATKTQNQLTTHPAIAVLHRMTCASDGKTKPAARMAATRTLADLANHYLED